MAGHESLDFSLWEHGRSLVIALVGPLDAIRAKALRQEAHVFAEQGRPIILDLLRVPTITEDAVLQLLSLQSDLRGKGGELSILCTQDEVLSRLDPWRNLFQIHPSLASFLATGFQEKGFRWSRRTGFRLAAPVAAFLSILLIGWITTLMILVVWQFHEMEDSRGKIEQLRSENQQVTQEISQLEERIRPLANLGLLEMPRSRKISRQTPKTKIVRSDTAAAPENVEKADSVAE